MPNPLSMQNKNTKQQLIKSLERNPRNPKNLMALGELCLAHNDLPEALEYLTRATKCAPDSFQAVRQLGIAYMKLGKIQSAHDCFKKAVSLNEASAAAKMNYANSLVALGEYEGAVSCYRDVSQSNQSLETVALSGIAEVAEKQGSAEEAFDILKPLIENQKLPPEGALVLAQLAINHDQYSSCLDQAIQLNEAVVKSTTAEREQKAKAYFKLGALLRKAGQVEHSFESFQSAHALIKSYFDFSELAENITKLKGNFARAKEPVSEKYKNIFVLGMPRSGTSLVDKIIGANKDVVSLGECNFFHHAVCEVCLDDDTAWGCMPIGEEQLIRVRSLYKQKYLVNNWPSRFVCDKSLENVFLVGQILQVFPDARLLWTRRDLRDVCLSCFVSDFAGRHSYAHDLKSLAKYSKMIEDLMSYWQNLYPHNFHVVNYEDFVTAPEEGIRSLVHFLGFQWDSHYLEFHSLPNRVKTLSYNDVQKPVYRHAVGKWKQYEKYLDPLLDELGR